MMAAGASAASDNFRAIGRKVGKSVGKLNKRAAGRLAQNQNAGLFASLLSRFR